MIPATQAPRAIATILAEVREFAEQLYAVPFEVLSRFLQAEPRQVLPAEIPAHLAAGHGLNCLERCRALADFLTRRGIANQILSVGFEYWHRGINLLTLRGRGSLPPDERYIEKFFAPGRPLRAPELPIWLGHWANQFELAGEQYLVDTTGSFTTFKFLGGELARRLLTEQPKPFLPYHVHGVRLYYHPLPARLFGLLEEKAREDLGFEVSRLLQSALHTGAQHQIAVQWWSRATRFQADASSQRGALHERTAGQASVAFYPDPEALLAAGLGLPDRFGALLRERWPSLRAWIGRLYENPEVIRLSVLRSTRPLIEFSSNEPRPGH